MQNCRKNAKQMFGSGLVAIILIVMDQITKYAAVSNLKEQPPFVIWDGVFELYYLENQSAAFGTDIISMIQNLFQFQYFAENPDRFITFKMGCFAGLTIIIVVVMIWIYGKIPVSRRYFWLNVILILFIAGAVGNLIDRIVQNYVVDFFYFKLIHFPVFNVADIYVTVAAFSFIVFGLFFYKEEDFEQLFPSKKKFEKLNKSKIIEIKEQIKEETK